MLGNPPRLLPAVSNRSTKILTGKTIEAQYDPPREGDIRDSQADISQAREFLGYDPQIGFEEGLARTLDWYRGTQTKAAAKSEK